MKSLICAILFILVTIRGDVFVMMPSSCEEHVFRGNAHMGAIVGAALVDPGHHRFLAVYMMAAVGHIIVATS